MSICPEPAESLENRLGVLSKWALVSSLSRFELRKRAGDSQSLWAIRSISDHGNDQRSAAGLKMMDAQCSGQPTASLYLVFCVIAPHQLNLEIPSQVSRLSDAHWIFKQNSSTSKEWVSWHIKVVKNGKVVVPKTAILYSKRREGGLDERK